MTLLFLMKSINRIQENGPHTHLDAENVIMQHGIPQLLK